MDLHQLRTLPADHIDLILTAAIDFGVISAPAGTPRPQQLLTAMAQRIGTGLFLRNQMADPAGYRYQPVDGPLDVRDVLKACHAAQFAYRDTKIWVGSNEQRVVDGVAKAAAMRVPGYELSPWVWTRPAEDAIGFAPAGQWHPADLDGVEWIDDLEEFTSRWAGARVVLVTADGLQQLPVLPARPRVFLIVETADAGIIADTNKPDRRQVESILVWPDARQWVVEQLLPAA